MQTPNERLRILRASLGLTQAEFAAKIGLKSTQIRDMELGRVKFSPIISKIIHSQFGVDEDWILSGVGEIFSSKTTIFKGQNNNQIGEVSGGIGVSTNTENLKYIEVYKTLEKLAELGGEQGNQTLLKELENLKNELKKFI